MARSRSVAKILVLTVAAGIGISFVWAHHLEDELRAARTTVRVPASFELWLHRAGETRFATLGTPFTPAILDRVVEAGYPGVELDVRWHPDRGLVVAHGATAEAPTLHAMLARHSRALSYWLDFKGLDTHIARAAAEPLARILDELDLSPHTYVEAADIEALGLLRRRAPELHLVARLTPARALRPSPFYLAALSDILTHGVDAVSIEHRRLDDGLATALAPLMIFAYTSDDAAEVERLRALGVEVLLTDRLPPL